jgi:hypothetical protein
MGVNALTSVETNSIQKHFKSYIGIPLNEYFSDIRKSIRGLVGI